MVQENEVMSNDDGCRKCPGCGSMVKESFNVCTKCGTTIKPGKTLQTVPKDGKAKVSSSLGIGLGGYTVIALVLLFQVSAILGMVLYFIGFGIAVNAFKDDERVEKGAYVELVKDCFKKENLLSKGILMTVILLIPIVLCVGLHRWIFADTMREVDYIYNQYGGY